MDDLLPAQAADDWSGVAAAAEGFGIGLLPPQILLFSRYEKLLLEWSRRFNLTALRDPREIREKHFIDSLAIGRVVDLSTCHTLLDLGTGAGFPGLVLKIAFPHLAVTLLDALNKRLRFLERVIAELGLVGVSVVHARAEDAARSVAGGKPALRERFDVVTARAVARLNVLTEWALPFVRVGGRMVAYKGPDVEQEVAEAGPAVAALGGGDCSVVRLQLPGGVGRSLVVVPKVGRTPAHLPRMAGAARKSPISADNQQGKRAR